MLRKKPNKNLVGFGKNVRQNSKINNVALKFDERSMSRIFQLANLIVQLVYRSLVHCATHYISLWVTR